MKVSDSIVLPEDSLEIVVRFVRLYDVTLLEENLEIVSPLNVFQKPSLVERVMGSTTFCLFGCNS